MRLPLLTLILCVTTLSVMAQRTTRRNLKELPRIDTTSATAITVDTLREIDANVVTISGYDKPLSSHHETFFATNNGNCTITAINITFDYRDRKNRQLHSVTTTIDCEIPAGQTRQITISSWDKQKSFYYYLSAKPRRKATPYSVRHTINFLLTKPR